MDKVLLVEAFSLTSCTTILGVFYGITFSLYCLCAWSLYLKLQDPDKQRQTMFSLGYISFLLLCATGLLAVGAQVTQQGVTNADFPGGSLRHNSQTSLITSDTSLALATGDILNVIIELLTMVVQVWRLWIIWSATQYTVIVTIPPMLLLLAYIALAIPMDIVISTVNGPPLLGLIRTQLDALLTTSYIVFSSFTTLVTGLIAGHILYVQRRLTKAMGMSATTSPYLSIVAMLVESYVLEFAWSLATAISIPLHNPSFALFMTNDSIIKIIAYFLIVYRVEKGQGWTKQTEEKLTSLQFSHGTQTATDEASGLGSQVSASPQP